MDEVIEMYNELERKRKKIEADQSAYEKDYKKMLIKFLQASRLNKYVKIKETNEIGIFKVDRENTSAFPYVIKFYPLKSNGVPNMNATHQHFLIKNDFQEIMDNAVEVQVEFYK